MKKTNKVSSLLLISIVTGLGLMVTGAAAHASFLELKVTNNSPFNVWVKNVEAVNLVSGNVEARWKENFGSNMPGITEMSPLTPGGSATSHWDSWAPGIKQIEWKGVGGVYAGSEGKSKNYNATNVTLSLSKSTSTEGMATVNFELSADKSGQDQSIPFKYEGKDYTLHVTVKATPKVWTGDTWNETYYNYDVEIK